MEKRDYYYFKEILLGLRDEYLQFKQELDKLGQYVETSDQDKIEKLSFLISKKNSDTKPELYCKIVKKENGLDQIKKKLRVQDCGYTTHECYFNNNGQTIIKQGNIYLYGISPEFCNQAKLILNSEFANTTYRISSNEDNKFFISVTPQSLTCDRLIEGEGWATLQYIPYNRINVAKPNGNFSEENLNAILYSKISKESILSYHQGIIDSNISTQKRIELIGNPNKYLNNSFLMYEPMQLEEEKNKFVLKKIK